MYTNFLKNFTFTMYGQSHSKTIGAVINYVPIGFIIDIEKINILLKKRNPDTFFNTKRKDSVEVIFNSGLENGKTTGTPLSFYLTNDNIKPTDYNKNTFRMDHADYTSYKYFGENYPYSGGGPFSGRMVAIYVVIGEFARQLLFKKTQYNLVSQIKQIHDIEIPSISNMTIDQNCKEYDDIMFIHDKDKKEEVITLLKKIKAENDTVGAKLEFKISGLKEILGNLYFSSFESILSHALFSIPGLKGLAFGVGDEFYLKRGSELTTKVSTHNNFITSHENINGGLNGGLTNGYEDIYFTCIIKPPMSLGKEIQLVKNDNGQLSTFTGNINGRHDTFIGNKAIYAIEGWLHIIILDLIMENNKKDKL